MTELEYYHLANYNKIGDLGSYQKLLKLLCKADREFYNE